MKFSLITYRYYLSFISLLLLCSSCSSLVAPEHNPEMPMIITAANSGDFGLRPDIPTPDDIHRLNADQKRKFMKFMNDPANARIQAHRRLYQYLDKAIRDFAYEGQTFSASQTLALNSGNCMALAILTTALVDIVGLEIDYQLMDDFPVYELSDSIVKKGLHIRSKIYINEFVEMEGAYLLSRPGIRIDYFPTQRERFIGNMDKNEYLAMLYQNLAVEAMDVSDLNLAYWYSLESLTFSPSNSAALNTLAVLNRRNGDDDTAEFIYQYGIEHAEEKLSLLKNYYVLLESQGRNSEAEQINSRLNAMTDPSPFHWYQLGRSAFDNREYSEAISFYNKALNLAPYLHEAYLGIAQANYEMGRLNRTQIALEAAFDEAEKVSTKNIYQAKLVSLSRQLPR